MCNKTLGVFIKLTLILCEKCNNKIPFIIKHYTLYYIIYVFYVDKQYYSQNS